jgi:hypothetical protein
VGPPGLRGERGESVPENAVIGLLQRISDLERESKKYVFDRRAVLRGAVGLDGRPGQAESGLATFIADCLPSDVIDHCVYITGPSIVGIAQVTRVDPKTTGLVKPSIGVITAKASGTRCTVTVLGEVVVSSVVLAPGLPHWVGPDGKPTPTLPVPDPVGKIACQVIGTALDATRLLVNPERRPTIRVSP